MRRYKSDPRWITARRAGHCSQTGCDQTFAVGDRVFFFPIGSFTYPRACGHGDWHSRDFEARRQDDDFNPCM